MKSEHVRNSKKTTVVLLILFALVVMAAGIYTSLKKDHQKSVDFAQLNATVLPQARAIPAFELTDDEQRPFTQEQLVGQWSLLYFGFTHCAHICPMAMTNLQQIYQQLVADQIEPLPQVVLVSVDPQRDTPDVMHQYVKRFNTAFRGVTASDTTQLDVLTKPLGIAYFKMESAQGDTNSYSVEHSDSFVLINPQAELAAFFTPPHDANLIANEYALIIANR
ncbi:MAG: redoxin domain-containing protein [Legionellales bacterium]|nr:redoxin domain-containing protein [Legionellales bacterium]